MNFLEHLQAIWIVGPDGKMLFVREFHISGFQSAKSAMFGGIISAIQNLATEFGDNSAKKVKMGNVIIFMAKDGNTQVVIALKCHEKSKKKKVTELLNKIKYNFLRNFIDFSTLDGSDIEILSSFKNNLDKILQLYGKYKVDRFRENLGLKTDLINNQ